MCRIPKVLLVAPADKQADLRRAISSLDYDVVAAVESAKEADGITADAAVLWEPDADTLTVLRARGVKTAAVGSDGTGADIHIPTDDVSQFKTRIWELFRPD